MTRCSTGSVSSDSRLRPYDCRVPVISTRSFIATAFALPCLLVMGMMVAGCGSGPDREEDRAQIEALFERISSANVRQDARAYCEVFSPESLEKAFISLSRCIRETDDVFTRSRESGVAPTRLEVAEVTFVDDRARVELTGRTGEANLIEQDGRWYLELVEEPPSEFTTREGADS